LRSGAPASRRCAQNIVRPPNVATRISAPIAVAGHKIDDAALENFVADANVIIAGTTSLWQYCWGVHSTMSNR